MLQELLDRGLCAAVHGNSSSPYTVRRGRDSYACGSSKSPRSVTPPRLHPTLPSRGWKATRNLFGFVLSAEIADNVTPMTPEQIQQRMAELAPWFYPFDFGNGVKA